MMLSSKPGLAIEMGEVIATELRPLNLRKSWKRNERLLNLQVEIS